MSIRRRLSRVEAAEVNGKRLLDAARELFTKLGYHATTLDAVAAAAGFTKGVVYARYASKAELFLALVEQRVERRIAEMEALSPVGLVDALARQQEQRIDSERAWLLVVTEFRVAAAREPSLNKRYAAIHERLIQAIAVALERGAAAERRELARPARELAGVFSAIGAGMMIELVTVEDAFPNAVIDLVNRTLFEATTRPARAKAIKGGGR